MKSALSSKPAYIDINPLADANSGRQADVSEDISNGDDDLRSHSRAFQKPAGRTIDATCKHYGWTRTWTFGRLADGKLEARKAGRRTIITTESSDRLFASLPRATYRAA
jgi:hypothetical protein